MKSKIIWWIIIIVILVLIGAGAWMLSSSEQVVSEEPPQFPKTNTTERGDLAVEEDGKQEVENGGHNPAPVETPPEPKPELGGLPYCNNAFEEHRQIASEYVEQFDDPKIGDDEFVIWRNTASGVGRCNNGNTQSTRFLFGHGEVLVDRNGNPEAYVGYLVVDGDSSEVSVFEKCNEGRCLPAEWCTPIYGPSYCSDGECTDDEVFKGCQ